MSDQRDSRPRVGWNAADLVILIWLAGIVLVVWGLSVLTRQ
jgi:hypothetical protein